MGLSWLNGILFLNKQGLCHVITRYYLYKYHVDSNLIQLKLAKFWIANLTKAMVWLIIVGNLTSMDDNST
jgi:hypothetical protein